LILDLANVWKFATLIKIKKTTDEKLQDAAAGYGHFNDGQLCFRLDLDADRRFHQQLDLCCVFGGWKQAGGDWPWALCFIEFRRILDADQRAH
jgi:hypothetical protein